MFIFFSFLWSNMQYNEKNMNITRKETMNQTKMLQQKIKTKGEKAPYKRGANWIRNLAEELRKRKKKKNAYNYI